MQDIVPNACGEAMDSAAAALPHFLDAVLLLKVQHNLPASMLWWQPPVQHVTIPEPATARFDCFCTAIAFKDMCHTCNQHTGSRHDVLAKHHPALPFHLGTDRAFLLRTIDFAGVDETAGNGRACRRFRRGFGCCICCSHGLIRAAGVPSLLSLPCGSALCTLHLQWNPVLKAVHARDLELGGQHL